MAHAVHAVLDAAERWVDGTEGERTRGLSLELLAAVARMRAVRERPPSDPPPALAEDEAPTEPRRRMP